MVTANIDPNNTCLDSLAGGSQDITINAITAATATIAPTANSADGYYGKPNSGMNGDTQPSSKTEDLYLKSGNQVYPVDASLATAIFIRTGTAPGEPPCIPGTL